MSVLTRRVAVCIFAFVALAVAGPAFAQTKLKWAHVYETSEPYHKWAVWAGEEFKKRTNGKYEIQVFPASSLGKESDINEGLGLGTVDIIYTGQLFAGRSFGPLAIGGAPFMFRDYGHWNAFRNSPLFVELAEGYKKKTGNEVIALTYYGERHTTVEQGDQQARGHEGPEDPRAGRAALRHVPEGGRRQCHADRVCRSLSRARQGTVDAQENPLPTIQAKKFYEVQKHIVLTGHITDALLTIVGGPTWGKLNADERKTLTTVLKEAADKATADIVKSEKDLVGWFKQQGKNVVAVDRKPFRDAVVKLHLSSRRDLGQGDLRQAAGAKVGDELIAVAIVVTSTQGNEAGAGEQPASGDLHQLFKEWEKQEEQVDLSDLRRRIRSSS